MRFMPYPPVRLFLVPWLIPSWAQAQVWGRFILLRRGVRLTEDLLAHELVHVQQWRTLGVFPFIWRYLAGLLSCGYWRHPLEQEARTASCDPYYRQWARALLSQAR